MTPNQFAEWRKGLGFNRLQAAKALGMSRNTLKAYEDGQKIPIYVEYACYWISRGMS